jgi:carbon monoxide dehydrogenase subunit G
MMLHFEGEKTVAQDPATCWAKITDPKFLAQCIPDLESSQQLGPDQARFRLRPGVSFVRGSLEVTLKIERQKATQSARYLVHSGGIASSSDTEALVTVEPVDAGCHLRWTVEIKSLGGLLKAIPQGLIKASAQKVVSDIWSAVDKKLAE